MRASSYLALPPIQRWFAGNIGYHHVHHLNPRIPNYRLRASRRFSFTVRRQGIRNAIDDVR